MKRLLFVLPIIVLSACNDTDSATTRSTEPDPTPQIDTDPTPDTGTGGATQQIAPDGTLNGAPGANPMNNQPTPSDN